MPFGSQPKCCMCKSNTSSMWRKNEDEEVICNSCSVRAATINNHKSSALSCPFTFRKSTRVKSSKFKQQILGKLCSSKGKNRRQSFKKSCTKAPPPLIAPIEGTSVFYEGTYFQIGDIVAVTDESDDVYYSQIRGLLQDQYCNKSAVLTWLLPTQDSPKDGSFDMATFMLGPEEELPIKLECLKFVCHSKYDYLMARDLTYPVLPPKPEFGFLQTRTGLQTVPLPEKEEVFTVHAKDFCPVVVLSKPPDDRSVKATAVEVISGPSAMKQPALPLALST